MWGNQIWMSDDTITQWPRGTLIDPVFGVEEEIEKFSEPRLRMTNPIYDLIAISL